MITNLGVVLVLISALGYASNWLNGRFLNYRITYLLYYVGAVVHETSHAAFCILTGAPIREYVVFARQPHVTYGRPRIPLVGNLLISVAPIAGGLLFLFLVDRYFLSGAFAMPHFSSWQSVAAGSWQLLSQFSPFEWQSWVMILLLLNVGAMIGPSRRDLMNVWPLVVVLFFVWSSELAALGLLAVALILACIVIQLILVAIDRIAAAFSV